MSFGNALSGFGGWGSIVLSTWPRLGQHLDALSLSSVPAINTPRREEISAGRSGAGGVFLFSCLILLHERERERFDRLAAESSISRRWDSEKEAPKPLSLYLVRSSRSGGRRRSTLVVIVCLDRTRLRRGPAGKRAD